MSEQEDNSLRILVVTPTGNDALNAMLVLREAGLQPVVCVTLNDACGQVVEGAGALLIAEEAFTQTETDRLVGILQRQEPWSDIPIILITAGQDMNGPGLSPLNILAPAGNVTLLERPLRPATMISSVQVALRARRRQYQMRDLLEDQRLVLASIHEAFVTINRDWRFTYVSDRAAEIARFPKEKMMGRSCWELFSDLNRDLFEGLHRAMEERVPVTVEHSCPPGDFWFESRVFPSAIGVSVFTRDITKRKQAEDALHQSRDELEKRVEERTARLKETISELEAFSYSVSHDLRTPLRAIQGYSEFLWAEYGPQVDEAGKEYIRRILQASGRLDHLVQDVLTYSRVTRAELDLEDVDLEELIDGVILSYPPLHPANAQIELQRPLLRVRGHQGSLIQVFSNLLTNAVKFVAEGRKPRIRIRTESSTDTVRVSVEDNGIGIPPEHQERIFRMFEKGPHTRVFEGTGIGLAIVRKAIDRMGGRVGVESVPGQGSRFWVELPHRNK